VRRDTLTLAIQGHFAEGMPVLADNTGMIMAELRGEVVLVYER
jgi:hypothetical protein